MGTEMNEQTDREKKHPFILWKMFYKSYKPWKLKGKKTAPA